MPEVAVVIPAYNPGPHLSRSLGSVLAQKFTDWECVVVDDGSVDPIDLAELVEVADDARIRVHRQLNAGVSVARNVGVGLTDSRWVAFLDQDDVWHPDKLSRQLAGLSASPDAAFSHTGFVWSLPTGSQVSRKVQVSYADLLAGRSHVLLSSLLVRRDAYVAVGGNDPLLRQQQDWALALNLCRLFGAPAHVPDALVTYVVHEANASRDYALAAAEATWVLGAHRAAALAAGDSDAARAARQGLRHTYRLHARQGVETARRAKGTGDWSEMLSHLGRAARLDPSVLWQAATDTVSAQVGQVLGRARS